MREGCVNECAWKLWQGQGRCAARCEKEVVECLLPDTLLNTGGQGSDEEEREGRESTLAKSASPQSSTLARHCLAYNPLHHPFFHHCSRCCHSLTRAQKRFHAVELIIRITKKRGGWFGGRRHSSTLRAPGASDQLLPCTQLYP